MPVTMKDTKTNKWDSTEKKGRAQYSDNYYDNTFSERQIFIFIKFENFD